MWRAFWEVETPQRKALCLGWFQSRDELEHTKNLVKGMRILTVWQKMYVDIYIYICWKRLDAPNYLKHLRGLHRAIYLPTKAVEFLLCTPTGRHGHGRPRCSRICLYPSKIIFSLEAHQDGLEWMTRSLANLRSFKKGRIVLTQSIVLQ